MFWQALQFSCCSPERIMGETLSWQLQAGIISLAFRPIHVWIFKNGVEFEAKLFRLPAIAGREAFAVLEKVGGGGSVKEGRGRKPRGLATSCYHSCPQALSPGVGEDHREWSFAQWKCLFSLQVSLGQTCPAGLAAEGKPVTHKQGGRVGCVLTDCLWLIEGKMLCISGKSVRMVVLTFTPFSKIQTYIAPECFSRPSSLAAVAPNQSWGRLCELAAVTTV